MSTVLVELFRHNTWANGCLLEACAGLDDGVLDATGAGTFGSVRETLVHLFGAQGRYVQVLTGSPPEPMVSEREPWPGFERLRASAEVSNHALEEVAVRADSMGILRGERGGKPYALPVAVVMTQAINHATEHRAHINTILTQAGIEPVSIDSWAWHEQGRA